VCRLLQADLNADKVTREDCIFNFTESDYFLSAVSPASSASDGSENFFISVVNSKYGYLKVN